MKLFGKGGKLNIIDILVILILVAAIVFAGMKLLGGSAEDDSDAASGSAVESLSTPNLRFTLVREELSPEMAQNIMDALLNETPLPLTGLEETKGTVAANRLMVGTAFADAQVTECRIDEGTEEKVSLFITIEAKGTPKNGVYSVGTQEVRVAKDFWLKTLEVEVLCTVSSLEKLS